jgi:hypothetical protein
MFLSVAGLEHLCMAAHTEQGKAVRELYRQAKAKWDLTKQIAPQVANEVEMMHMKIELARIEAQKEFAIAQAKQADRILSIKDLDPDHVQCGISGDNRAILKDRGFVRSDGTKAKDYMIRTIEKTEKNKAKAEKTVIKGDKKIEEPTEPSENASEKDWNEYYKKQELWLKHGDDSPYKTVITAPTKTVEQRQQEKYEEKKAEEAKVIKTIPVSVRRDMDRQAYNDLAKANGVYVDGGYPNEEARQDGSQRWEWDREKVTKREAKQRKEAIAIYKKEAKMQAYRDFKKYHPDKFAIAFPNAPKDF